MDTTTTGGWRWINTHWSYQEEWKWGKKLWHSKLLLPNVTSYACKGERECLVPFSFLWSLEQPRLCDILTLSNTHIIPIWKLFWSFHDIKRDRWGIGSLDPLLVYSLPPLRIRLLKWSGFACTLYWPARLPRPYLACEFPSLLLACEFCQNHEMFWATCLL